MGQAALLMRACGHVVAGADGPLYPPMSDVLHEAQIAIDTGYTPEALQAFEPDCVVIGNVHTRGNAVVEWLLRTRRYRWVSLPALLHDHLLFHRKTIVVTGTHGKTTTTALTAFLLREAGGQPGWFIGGVPRDLPGGAQVGAAEAPFVIEGDEYDSAFFDKRSKFIHYAPQLLVLNNLELDHLDIFRDLQDLQRSFRHALRLVPQDGAILANADDPNVQALLPVSWTRHLQVGLHEAADLRIEAFQEDADGSRFLLRWQGQLWGEVRWQQWGLFNARNAAMAALAAGLALDPADPTQLSLEPLSAFRGVQRRQECLYDDGRRALISDFAHHPTAVEGVLRALRGRYPGWELIACFEPRSNTACRSTLQEAFLQALAWADRVHFAPVYRAERYSAAERLDTEALARALAPRAEAHVAHDQLLDCLVDALGLGEGGAGRADARPQLVVLLSNGAFGGVPGRLLERLQAAPGDQAPTDSVGADG